MEGPAVPAAGAVKLATATATRHSASTRSAVNRNAL